MLQINQVFYSHVKSSHGNKIPSSSIHFTSLHFTYNLHSQLRTLNYFTHLKSITSNHTIRTSPTMNLPRLSPTENYYSRTTCKRASVSPINPWSDMRENRALLLLLHCGNAWRHFRTHGGHVTHPNSCVIQMFIAVAWQRETCLPQRYVATVAGRHSQPGRQRFLLLLHDRGNMFHGYSSYVA
jgi:hypothetical protein